MEILQIKDLSFTYPNGKRALKGINLKVKEGESVLIMGETGAGKSTLCYCLNGLVPKFKGGELQGEILLGSNPIKDKKVYELAKQVGLVFQDFEAQLFSSSVELEVAFGPENLGLDRTQIKERIYKSLSMVGLAGFNKRHPITLSGGEKQRLAIASVLASSPKLLVMDEPTTDLDPVGKREIFDSVKHLQEEGITLVMVEHETEKAGEVNRILIMKEGYIIQCGSPTAILKDVEFLETHGIMPLQIAKFFYEMEDKDPPLTVEEGYKRFVRKRLKFSEKKYELMEVAEMKRKKRYGKVIIEVKDVEYRYEDEKSALHGVNLSIHQGEFVAIVGQNGSGKTTLVKHFNGLLKPGRGEVRVKGMDTRKVSVSELSKVVGYVFQDPDHQIFADNVYSEVSFGPRNFGLPQEEIKIRVNEALSAVQLEGYQDKDPFSLTKGERQRVAVASILASKPEILIFDEPTTGLDYSQTKETMRLIKKLNEIGHTIIVVTHCMWVVAEYAHRCVVMREGRIVLDENTRTLFSKEEDLEKNSLTPPQIVRLSNMFGKVLLSVDELKSCLG